MVYGITPIHLIGIAVSVALFYQSIRLVRKQKESVFEFLLWTGFGAAIFVLSLGQLLTISGLLEGLSFLLSLLGFQTGTNGIFTLAILGLLLLLYYTYNNAKTNRQKIADMNQELSLLEYQMEQMDKKTTGMTGEGRDPGEK
jgi:hypothetical protein